MHTRCQSGQFLAYDLHHTLSLFSRLLPRLSKIRRLRRRHNQRGIRRVQLERERLTVFARETSVTSACHRFLSLSLSHTHTHSLSHIHTHTHTHTHCLSHSLSLTHTPFSVSHPWTVRLSLFFMTPDTHLFLSHPQTRSPVGIPLFHTGVLCSSCSFPLISPSIPRS